MKFRVQLARVVDDHSATFFGIDARLQIDIHADGLRAAIGEKLEPAEYEITVKQANTAGAKLKIVPQMKRKKERIPA